MRKVTTTNKIHETIANNLLQITKAKVYYKTSRKTEIIDADKFKDSLDFLCESGCFADAIGWFYEKDFKTGSYEVDCGRMNPNTDIIIIAHLCANSGINAEDIDKALLLQED